MLIPYILSGSITVLSQRSTAAKQGRSKRASRSGAAARRPGSQRSRVSPIRGRPGGPAVGRIPEFLANTGAGDIALAAGRAVARRPRTTSWAPLSSRCGDLLLAVLGILAGAVLCAGWGFGNVAGWDVAGATPEVRPE